MEGALYLAEKGCDVTLITARLNVGEGVHQYLRNEYMKKLYELNIKMITHHDFGGIKDGNTIVRNLFTHETKERKDWDRIILSVGRVPDTEFYEEIKSLAPEVKQIGDCLAPRTIEEATHEGFFTMLNPKSELINSH
jgi:pyruvate/2-oxoglutarate dehydrogenase complex dihydrolipoamide dehydrogenase (E3) component